MDHGKLKELEFFSTFGKLSKKRVLIFALSALITIGNSVVSGARCYASNSNNATLASIEQKLFMKSYDHDPEETRISRVEKNVFGAPVPGDLNERLQRIIEAVGPNRDPDGSVSGLCSKKSEAVSAPYKQQQVPQAEQRMESKSAPYLDDQQSAIQRAQIAVQAAREERINHLMEEGVQAWRGKRGPLAIEKFEEVLRLDPHNAQANFSMGIAYESVGNFIEAVACYKRASNENPDNKEYAEALRATERKSRGKLTALDKQAQVRNLAVEAKEAFDRQEYISALSFYKEMDQKVPNQALIKYNIGTCYMMVKNPISALEYYKQAHKLKPDEPRYASACEQLESNVTNARQQREQAEAAWSDVDQPPGRSSSNPKPKKPKKLSSAPGTVGVLNQGTPDLMGSLGLIGKSSHQGVSIIAVGIASRASHVGILNGDIIKAVEGVVVKNVDDVNKVLSRKAPGTQVQLTIQRGANMANFGL